VGLKERDWAAIDHHEAPEVPRLRCAQEDDHPRESQARDCLRVRVLLQILKNESL
jgi:hypothetical protein